jgi:hypothetical protein
MIGARAREAQSAPARLLFCWHSRRSHALRRRTPLPRRLARRLVRNAHDRRAPTGAQSHRSPSASPADTGSALTWRTVFNADTVRGLRDYRLIVRDAARGRYATDERSAILLDETLIAGSLISVFRSGSACWRTGTRCAVTR